MPSSAWSAGPGAGLVGGPGPRGCPRAHRPQGPRLLRLRDRGEWRAADLVFFFNDTATTEIYTLSPTRRSSDLPRLARWEGGRGFQSTRPARGATRSAAARSEEHTSELQSPKDLVCRLLLE